jgi:hypothetical protein
MALKKHAAVVEQFGEPSSLLELDIPSPGAGQILVKTEGLRSLPYRSPCGPRRLAGEAYAPVHSWP